MDAVIRKIGADLRISLGKSDWDLPTDLPLSFVDFHFQRGKTMKDETRVVSITKEAHRALKIRAAELDRKVSELANQAILEWCTGQPDRLVGDGGSER